MQRKKRVSMSEKDLRRQGSRREVCMRPSAQEHDSCQLPVIGEDTMLRRGSWPGASSTPLNQVSSSSGRDARVSSLPRHTQDTALAIDPIKYFWTEINWLLTLFWFLKFKKRNREGTKEKVRGCLTMKMWFKELMPSKSWVHTMSNLHSRLPQLWDFNFVW